MKKVTFSFVFALLILTNAFAQVQKSLVKSFNLNGATTVVYDLKGEVQLKVAENAALRLQTDIDLKNGNINLFQAFLAKKRYDVQVNNQNGVFTLTAPDRESIKIGGQDLQEVVTYILYVPEKASAQIVKNGLQTSVIVTTSTVATR